MKSLALVVLPVYSTSQVCIDTDTGICMYYQFFLRNKSRLTSMIGLHFLYMLFKEGVLDQSVCDTCEMMGSRKERNEYLFDFYLSRVSVSTFMTFL